MQIRAVKKYPDISEIIKRKEEYRRALAALPFERKIELVFKIKERREFIESGWLVKKSRQTEVKIT